MKLRVVADYDFPDTKKWQLFNGERIEGEIVWFAKSYAEEGVEPGFHLDMMEVGDESNDFEEYLQCVDVYDTYDEALKAAMEHQR